MALIISTKFYDYIYILVENLIPGIFPGYSSSILFELYSDDEGQNPQIKVQQILCCLALT